MGKLREIFAALFRPAGKRLNTDIDPRNLTEGFTDSLNTRSYTPKGNSYGDRDIVRGNELAFSLPVIAAQDKIFRVYLSSVTADTYTLLIKDANGNTLATAIWLSTAGDLAQTYLDATGASGSGTSISQALTGAGETFTIGTLVTTATDEGYFSLEITTINYWDYQLSLTSTASSATLPIVTQEAIDVGMAGQLLTIGSHDLNGDLFVWSTAQENLPTEIDIISMANNGAGQIRILVSSTVGFVDDQAVKISGASGASNANGEWIIDVIDATHIDLLGSTFASSSAGTLINYPFGYGQIGVAVRDDNTLVYTYTPLLSSREFNFRFTKRIKNYCERNDRLASLYFTDEYNSPRVFYYQGDYITNGALSFVNSIGEYEYGSIDSELRLILSSSTIVVAFAAQIQSGGGVTAGNWRYAVRLLTENFSPTPLSDPTNPVNVSIPDSTAGLLATNFGGNNSYVVTGKQNYLTVSGIIPNLFKYVELIGLYYVDGSPIPVATIIKRDLLTQEPSQTIIHTGNETGSENFDIAQFAETSPDILTAGSICSVDKRLVLGKITTGTAVDFSSFTASWTHTLNVTDGTSGRPTVSAVLFPERGNYNAQEYIIPFNVNNRVGYMFNEIYAFLAKFKLKNGFITEDYWVDFIRFDTLATNLIANPPGNSWGGTDRRAANNITTYDLTNPLATEIRVPYLEFGNIDLDFLIDGVKVSELIDEIIIERVDLTDSQKEIVATGVIILGVTDWDLTFSTGYPGNPGVRDEYPSTSSPTQFGEWGYSSGMYFDATSGFPNNPNINDVDGLGLVTVQYKYCAFYAPDLYYGDIEIGDVQSADVLLSYDAPGNIQDVQVGVFGTGTGVAIYSTFREYNGENGQDSTTVQSCVVNEVVNVPYGGTGVINGQTWTKRRQIVFTAGGSRNFFWNNPTSPVIYVNTDIVSDGNGYALNMAQYYRFKGSTKFNGGNLVGLKGVPVGRSLSIDGLSGVVTIDNIFGGDTFTQKTYIRHRTAITELFGGADYTGTGFGGGFGFYSQNRVNTQMRNTGVDQHSTYRYPELDGTSWLEDVDTVGAGPEYSSGYNIENGVSQNAVFDPNLPRTNTEPAREYYSDLKPENSVIDNYRTFLPLNFYDLPLGDGPITELRNINGELMSFQGRAFCFQYFNSSGVLVTSAGEAVLGNAGVLTRKPATLSRHGTSHPFSVITGTTAGGKDACAWIDTESRKVMRYAPTDGTVIISERGLNSFFNNNLRFTWNNFLSIQGVWDEQHSEYIWTIVARKQVDLWVEAGTYQTGQEVFYQPDIYSTFNQTGEIYVSLIDDNTGNFPDGDNAAWQLIKHDNPNYYNEYTVSFSEISNGWETFYSFLPYIYLTYKNTFLSPRPVEHKYLIYEHGKGLWARWYEDQGATTSDVEQAVDGYYSSAINVNPTDIKVAYAVRMRTDITPEQVRIYSSGGQETFMDGAQFTFREMNYDAPVRNDILTSTDGQTPTEDTSKLIGDYFIVKLIFKTKVYQKLYQYLLRLRIRSRNSQS